MRCKVGLSSFLLSLVVAAPSGCAKDSDAGDEETEGAGDESTDGGETVVMGCDDTRLRPLPDDPAEEGPWPVGVQTVTIGDLTVEVWYPAAPGSQEGQDPEQYDIRSFLPEAERTKISDADSPVQVCDCVRGLPVDDERGPYPVILFVHGTASFRTQSLPQVTHWASRGFVVLAADHPGLKLGDLLGSICGGPSIEQDLSGDLQAMLAALRGDTPELESFAQVLDAGRIGMSGHSAGGGAIASLGSVAQVLVPLASRGVQPGDALQSTLIMGGTADAIVEYAEQVMGYASSPAPKRLVGIENAGHLAFSEICSVTNDAGDDLLTIASENGVCGANFATALFQCSPDLIPDERAWEIVDYATSAAFEEVLHCAEGDPFADLEARFEAVAEFRSE